MVICLKNIANVNVWKSKLVRIVHDYTQKIVGLADFYKPMKKINWVSQCHVQKNAMIVFKYKKLKRFKEIFFLKINVA